MSLDSVVFFLRRTPLLQRFEPISRLVNQYSLHWELPHVPPFHGLVLVRHSEFYPKSRCDTIDNNSPKPFLPEGSAEFTGHGANFSKYIHSPKRKNGIENFSYIRYLLPSDIPNGNHRLDDGTSGIGQVGCVQLSRFRLFFHFLPGFASILDRWM